MRTQPLFTVILALLFSSAVARAESRTVLIQIKKDKGGKTVVAIHSDVRKEQKKAVSVDEAVKVIAGMKGWGSMVGAYVQWDRSAPRGDVKKLLGAILDNIWLDLHHFGPDVPSVVGDHFLKTEPRK
jgi:hypothetical protein